MQRPGAGIRGSEGQLHFGAGAYSGLVGWASSCCGVPVIFIGAYTDADLERPVGILGV